MTDLGDMQIELGRVHADLDAVRYLVGDPDVAEVARAIEAAAVAYGPVRVVQLADDPDVDRFGAAVDEALAGFYRALAAAAIGAMGDGAQ